MLAVVRWCLAPVCVFLAACSGISVHSTHDPDFDFGKAKSYDWLTTPAEVQTSVDDASLRDLLAGELESKGLYRNQQTPDLLVAMHRTIEGTLHTRGSGYEIKDGRIATYELQSGTLVVDLIAAGNREAVWRGTATGTFRADLLPDERREILVGVFEDMFADYPEAR
jgi:hypothetical protein